MWLDPIIYGLADFLGWPFTQEENGTDAHCILESFFKKMDSGLSGMFGW